MVELLEIPQVYYPQYKDSYVVVQGSQGPGVVCASSLQNNMAAANVVCKSTIKYFAFQVRSGVVQPQYFGPRRYLATFDCTGEEYDLRDCSRVQLVPVDSCYGSGFDAIVDCITGE